MPDAPGQRTRSERHQDLVVVGVSRALLRGASLAASSCTGRSMNPPRIPSIRSWASRSSHWCCGLSRQRADAGGAGRGTPLAFDAPRRLSRAAVRPRPQPDAARCHRAGTGRDAVRWLADPARLHHPGHISWPSSSGTEENALVRDFGRAYEAYRRACRALPAKPPSSRLTMPRVAPCRGGRTAAAPHRRARDAARCAPAPSRRLSAGHLDGAPMSRTVLSPSSPSRHAAAAVPQRRRPREMHLTTGVHRHPPRARTVTRRAAC